MDVKKITLSMPYIREVIKRNGVVSIYNATRTNFLIFSRVLHHFFLEVIKNDKIFPFIVTTRIHTQMLLKEYCFVI